MKNRSVTMMMAFAVMLLAPAFASAQTVAITTFKELPAANGLGDDVRAALTKHFTAAGYTVVEAEKVDAAGAGDKIDAAPSDQKLNVARRAASALSADFVVSGNVVSNGSAGLIATRIFGASAGDHGEGKPFASPAQIDAIAKDIVARLVAAIKDKKVA